MKQSSNSASNPTGMVPNGADLLKAGASGAAIAGTWTAISEAKRVRAGEATPADAVRATANSAAIGLGAGTVAHLVSHAVRQMPFLGLAMVAAAVVFYGGKQQESPDGGRAHHDDGPVDNTAA